MAQHVQITVSAVKGTDDKFYIESRGHMVPVDKKEIVLIDHGDDVFQPWEDEYERRDCAD